MHDSFFVRRFQRLGQLLGQSQRFVHGHRSARRFAGDIFQHQVLRAQVLLEPVDSGDVGVIQRCQGLCLAVESRQPLGVLREGCGQSFDCHVAIQLRVARAIHLAHPTRAQRREDIVWTEFRSC